jgi:FkbM family methyltransferase
MKLRDAIKLMLSPSLLSARRELGRVRKQPRYTRGVTNLFGRTLEYVDSSSYSFLHKEIFDEEVYSFKPTTEQPRIIDGGANIGLSVIYFKKRFPAARITAFEPDPSIADVLRRNLESQGFDDVEVRSEALWSHDAELSFRSEGADGGHVTNGDSSSVCRVSAVPLARFLGQPVDFLKLDIEGAEFEVLRSCKNQLGLVQKAFIEYHARADEPQTLASLLEILRDAGFRYFITAPSVFTPKPLLEIKSYNGFDMVLNIFCIRPEEAP